MNQVRIELSVPGSIPKQTRREIGRAEVDRLPIGLGSDRVPDARAERLRKNGRRAPTIWCRANEKLDQSWCRLDDYHCGVFLDDVSAQLLDCRNSFDCPQDVVADSQEHHVGARAVVGQHPYPRLDRRCRRHPEFSAFVLGARRQCDDCDHDDDTTSNESCEGGHTLTDHLKTILTITPSVRSILPQAGWSVVLVRAEVTRYRRVTMSSPDFLGRLSTRERDLIDARSVRRTYRRGATLFLEGDAASEVLLIQRGHIKITVGSKDGREVLLEIRGNGDIIGEMGLIDNSVRSATALALTTPTEVLVLSVRDFRTLVDTDQPFTRSLLDEMVRKLRHASFHELELALDDVSGRVARRLLDLDRRFGRMRAGVVRVKSPITQQEIADWAGVSRQAVVKELALLRELDIVEVKGSVMTILDREALVERAERLSGLS